MPELATERPDPTVERTDVPPVAIRRCGWAKRGLDVSVALGGLVLFSPLFLVCSVLAKLQSPGGVFFFGPRVGQGGKPFKMIKFRSMVDDAPKRGAGVTAANDRRITPIGRFLRRTKLDELPNLINVLKGDMSLVGPRPELPRYVALYTPEQRAVLAVRPGITGPTQLRFRDEEALLASHPDPETYYVSTVMPEKIALDLEYIANRSFWRDVGYLLQTAALVLRRFVSFLVPRTREKSS